jgi:hypothetical protein
MPRTTPPDDIVALADRRAVARRARDFATADALKAQLEAAGWKVVDVGSLYDLVQAHPEDVEIDGVVRYGASVTVPSRLDEAPVGVATVVLVADDFPGDVARAMHALMEHAPDGTGIVVVANAPSEAQAAALAGLDAADPGAPGVATEVVWLRERLGRAAALNAGIRRAAGPVVVLLDTSVEPAGDLVSAMAAALEDETVGVAGPFGLVSDDMRRFVPAPADLGDVDAIEGVALAFRREDVARRGELDEGFLTSASLDTWWSLVLRDPFAVDDDPADGGAGALRADDPGDPDDADPGAEAVAFVDLADLPAPRRAVVVRGVPVTRHESRAWQGVGDAARAKREKKAWYRFLKRFASRGDLLVGWAPAATDADGGADEPAVGHEDE